MGVSGVGGEQGSGGVQGSGGTSLEPSGEGGTTDTGSAGGRQGCSCQLGSSMTSGYGWVAAGQLGVLTLRRGRRRR
jgi:MYXO-CTERM domain-containing protein